MTEKFDLVKPLFVELKKVCDENDLALIINIFEKTNIPQQIEGTLYASVGIEEDTAKAGVDFLVEQQRGNKLYWDDFHDSLNWEEARTWLTEYEKIVESIPPESNFVLKNVIGGIRKRFDAGERTQKLHDEIMALS